VYELEPYTKDEILKYFWDTYPDGNEDDAYKCVEFCDTPGSVNQVQEYGAQSLFDYVTLMVENIFDVDLANAFKSSEKLAVKTDNGFDLKLFWNCFCVVCFEKGRYDAVNVTFKYLQKLDRAGVNKQQIYDMWILDIRGE
jgi:hypothetical protein